MDAAGKVVVEPVFDDATPFSEGLHQFNSTNDGVRSTSWASLSVPGHALRCGPETSVQPLAVAMVELRGNEKTYIQSSRPWELYGPPRYAATQCIAALGTRCSSIPTACH